MFRPAVDVDRVSLARGVVVATLASFVGLYMYYFVAINAAGSELGVRGYLEVLLLAVPVVALSVGAIWSFRADVATDLVPRVTLWMGAGLVLFLTVAGVAAVVLAEQLSALERFLLLYITAGTGAASGLVAGVFEVRARQYGRERARSRLRADRVERERRRLEHLNQALRHEVLNAANVIHGNAELLRERAPASDADRDRLRTIADRSDDIARFVQSIRDVLRATDHQPDVEPIDLGSVIRTEARAVASTHDGVRIDVAVPDGTRVHAGGLVNRVFANLLTNAAEHGAAGADGVAVHVVATVEAEAVAVRVTDDGRGIPDRVRERLFEPDLSGESGYGLFLTRTLVELYGGSLELVETGPDGTSFRVRLPRVDATGRAAERPATASVSASPSAGYPGPVEPR